jgi:hypothetical protein
MDMSLLTKGGLQVLLNILSITSTQILNVWKLFKYLHTSNFLKFQPSFTPYVIHFPLIYFIEYF